MATLTCTLPMRRIMSTPCMSRTLASFQPIGRLEWAPIGLLHLQDDLHGVIASFLLEEWCVGALRALMATCWQLQKSDSMWAVRSDPDYGRVNKRIRSFLVKAGRSAWHDLHGTTQICRPLKGWDAGDLEAVARLGGMGALRNLRKLILGANNIGDAGLATLCGNVPTGALVNLGELWLGGNKIGDEGVTALSAAFRAGKLPAVTVLSLATNEVRDAGMLALARALGAGPTRTLRELSLGGNPGDKGPFSAHGW